MKLLFVSNGHGEDAIGAHLAKNFLELDDTFEVEAMPIIGRGLAYERVNARVLGPRMELPSGGFTFTSLRLFWNDWQAGMRRMAHDQFWAIRRAQPDAVIVVGDVYALWATLRFTRTDGRTPRVFQYQPLVSLRYRQGMIARDWFDRLNRVTVDGFIGPELRLMRSVERVYARDEPSAAWLRDHGVAQARFVGNLMMDLLSPERDLGPILTGQPVVLLLPGSRDDYLFSLPLMLEAVGHLEGVQVMAAFGGDVSRLRLPPDWLWMNPSPLEREASADRVAVHAGGTRVPILRDAFAAALHHAQTVIGTSGTANEQAVGLGKPVIAFPTRGPQYLEPFARAQQRLLGPGLILTQPDTLEVLASVRAALTNRELLEIARRSGLERMGSPGGSRRLVNQVIEALQSQFKPS